MIRTYVHVVNFLYVLLIVGFNLVIYGSYSCEAEGAARGQATV